MLENIRQIGIFMIVAQTVIHFAAGKQYEKYMKIITGIIILLLFSRPFVSGSENITAKWQEETERMMKQIEERNAAEYQMSYAAYPAQDAAIRRIEEEIKDRLNEIIAEYGEQVTEVAIDLGEGGEQAGTGAGLRAEEPSLQCVRITVRKRSEAEEGSLYTEAGKEESIETVPGAGIQDQMDKWERFGGTDGPGKMKNEEQGIAPVREGGIRIGQIVVGEGTQKETGAGAADGGYEPEELRRLCAQTLGIAEDRVEVVYLGEW